MYFIVVFDIIIYKQALALLAAALFAWAVESVVSRSAMIDLSGEAVLGVVVDAALSVSHPFEGVVSKREDGEEKLDARPLEWFADELANNSGLSFSLFLLHESL